MLRNLVIPFIVANDTDAMNSKLDHLAHRIV